MMVFQMTKMKSKLMTKKMKILTKNYSRAKPCNLKSSTNQIIKLITIRAMTIILHIKHIIHTLRDKKGITVLSKGILLKRRRRKFHIEVMDLELSQPSPLKISSKQNINK
jgi:ABC-type cobalamin transport system ATPase subunit